VPGVAPLLGEAIASGAVTDVAQAKRGPVPEWIAKRLTNTGTAVVWSKCDRISSRRLDALRERLSIALGCAFRHFIWDGVEIRIEDAPIAPSCRGHSASTVAVTRAMAVCPPPVAWIPLGWQARHTHNRKVAAI
jgi:hypothetical protein